jgi:transposase
VKLSLTPGQRHDMTQAAELTDGIHDCELIGDKGYDADELVNALTARNVAVAIPPKSNRRVQRAYDKHTYKSRHLIENFFCRIKGCRRVATRYDKTATSYLAMVTIAGILAWLV